MKIIKKTSYACLIVLFLGAAQHVEAEANDSQTKGGMLGKEISDWDARLEYARVLSNMHRYDDALSQLQKLLAIRPESTVVKIEIAQILYYQEKQQEALQMLEEIPQKDMNEETRLLMADIYLALKDYSKAESIYRERLINKSNDDLTKFKLAELLSWQKRYDESVQLYQELLDKRPNDIQIRRKYALVLMWMGEDEEAAKELEKTLPLE